MIPFCFQETIPQYLCWILTKKQFEVLKIMNVKNYIINHQKLKISYHHPRYSSWLLINDLLALLTEQVLIVLRLFVCICAGANST